jgi:hypothetical protein
MRVGDDEVDPFCDRRHSGEPQLVGMYQQPDLTSWNWPTVRHVKTAQAWVTIRNKNWQQGLSRSSNGRLQCSLCVVDTN